MILCIVLLAAACTNGDSSGDATSTGSAGYAGYGVAGSGYSGGEGYTEEEIGVGLLVDEYLADRFGSDLTRYRTYEESWEADEAADNEFGSLSVEARDRAFFEQTVQLVFFAAGEAMPPAVESVVAILRQAFYDSLDLCSVRDEWPDFPLYLFENDRYYSTSEDQYESFLARSRMTADEFLDLRHECYKFAASYPALDRDYRDELMQTRRDYYLEVLRLWIRDHPERVVSMTYEQSVNHPYQDYVREICRASDDPQECARSEGVILE